MVRWTIELRGHLICSVTTFHGSLESLCCAYTQDPPSGAPEAPPLQKIYLDGPASSTLRVIHILLGIMDSQDLGPIYNPVAIQREETTPELDIPF